MKLREHPNDWCIRLTVYKPDAHHGSTHTSIGFEGAVADYFGEFLQALPLGAPRLNAEDIEALKTMTKKMRGGK